MQSPPSTQAPTLLVDLQFLLDRRLYHPLPTNEIAPGFADSKHQPPLGSSLESLIQAGHFRRAAETALVELLTSNAGDAARIFKILYTRLACLVVISRPDLAADEAVPLTEFLNRNTPDAKDILPIVPWELRLLLVRLQSIAAPEDDGGRRAIMSLYALASEVRSHISHAKTENASPETIRTWSDRLIDLSLRVADTLVENDDLATASRHLTTLSQSASTSNLPQREDLTSRQTLLALRTGNLALAHSLISTLPPSSSTQKTLTAHLQTTQGDFASAVESWRALAAAEDENNENNNNNTTNNVLPLQNLAVNLLYTNRISEARSVLEGIVRDSPAAVSPSVLFNLSTVYELCTNRAVERKEGLAMFLAGREPESGGAGGAGSGGWERTKGDFKL